MESYHNILKCRHSTFWQHKVFMWSEKGKNNDCQWEISCNERTAPKPAERKARLP